MALRAVILAAGRGTRLNHSQPKPLTRLVTGESILERQLRLLAPHVSRQDTIVVVGYRMRHVQEAAADCRFAVNQRYALTNTARSLSAGLALADDADVLFMNGDVVFEAEVLERLLACASSAMAVDRKSCGSEEVKYLTADGTHIAAVSKAVVDGEGEALGFNLVRRGDRPLLVDALERCGDSDYFERGVELAIHAGAVFAAIDVTDLLCVEIDFRGDLDLANALLENGI